MTDFDRIVNAAQAADAAQATARTNAALLREMKVRYARERFVAVGVEAYLREQAEAMLARDFWARSYSNGVADRASASLEFVPAPGVVYREDDITGTNTAHMVIESFGETVTCRLSARTRTDNDFPDVALAEFELAHVKAWFERFVRFGLDLNKGARGPGWLTAGGEQER